MARFVLTLVGADRAGLVAAVADIVAAHGGNWENSQLAELAGAFAGVVEISAPNDRADDLLAALHGLEGLLTITAHPGDAATAATEPRTLTLTVLGNDRPGIVREVSATLHAHALSIERMTTDVRDAAMYGGRLFEASVTARIPDDLDVAALRDDLERLASEIQVDVALGAE